MHVQFNVKLVAVSVAVALAVSGCAGTGSSQKQSSSAGSSDTCGAGTVVASALGGALLGAVLGGKKGAAAGAALGGGAAAVYCFAIKSESRQTKTAAQVDQEYRQKNQGNLPDSPMLTTYTTSVTPPNGVVNKGGVLEIKSQAQIVNGKYASADRVEEEFTMFYNNEQLQKRSRPMPGAGGAYESKTTLNVPEKFQDGAYTIGTRILVNGAPVGNAKSMKVQVVTVNGETRIALMDASVVDSTTAIF